MCEQKATYFLDRNGKQLGSCNEFLAFLLSEGMKVTLHGHSSEFRVVDWNYHHGHLDEKAGLRIILE